MSEIAIHPRVTRYRGRYPGHDQTLYEPVSWARLVNNVGLLFFHRHMDTYDIASAFGIRESTAYRALIAYRQQRERARA